MLIQRFLLSFEKLWKNYSVQLRFVPLVVVKYEPISFLSARNSSQQHQYVVLTFNKQKVIAVRTVGQEDLFARLFAKSAHPLS